MYCSWDGRAIRVSHMLVGGPGRICRENVPVRKELKFPMFKQGSCPCKPLALDFQKGKQLQSTALLLNLHISLSPAINQNNSSKRSGYWVRSLAILQAHLLDTSLSAPSQPEPLLGKSCNRQISLVRSHFSPQHMVWGWPCSDSQDEWAEGKQL